MLVKSAEREGYACATGSTRAAYAVNVCLGHIGDIVVDNHTQLLDVDTASSDVGGNHYARLARLEVIQGSLTLALRLIAVQSFAAHTLVAQSFRYVVGSVLGAGENQYRFILMLSQQLDQQLAFLGLLDKVDTLLNLIYG